MIDKASWRGTRLGSSPILLDGAIGTELSRRGVRLPDVAWSAAAIESAAETIAAIHREYAAAGAEVHTATTFRTTRNRVGQSARELTKLAVELARENVDRRGVVFGSVGPMSDCYRRQRVSPSALSHYQDHVDDLVAANVDGILCETFAEPDDAVAAASVATRTNLPVWVSLTAGYRGELMTTDEFILAAKRLFEIGASCVLLNCVAVRLVEPFLDAIDSLRFHGRFGIYANAGTTIDDVHWTWTAGVDDPASYAAAAKVWLDRGASVVGGCCGTTPEHIAAVHCDCFRDDPDH